MKSPIRKVVIDVVTSHVDRAGTKAQVFLGLGGREFRLSVPNRAAFELGAESTFQLGEDANVEFPERNDPRLGYPITVADVLGIPAYIRLDTRHDRDDWNVASVAVRVHSQGERRAIRFSALNKLGQSLWLGNDCGNLLYLTLGSLDDLSFVPEQ
jgi:hypothetical protein